MSEMVRRDLVIMPEEFDTLDEHINEVIDIRHTSDGSKFILNQTGSLEEFKGFYRRQYEQHLPFINGTEKYTG